MLLNIIDDICNVIVCIAEPTFDLLIMGGMTINWLLFTIGCVFGLAWLKKMWDYNKEVKENGTIQ